MSSLFDLQGDFLRLYEMGEEEEAFGDSLESLDYELALKGEGYVNVMNALEMEADKAEEIGKAFLRKAEVRRNNIKAMKRRLQLFMESTGKDKIPAGNYTITNKKNGGVQPLDYDEGKVPDSFMKVIYEPDTKKIREYLKDHTCDWARLKERGRHIEVR